MHPLGRFPWPVCARRKRTHSAIHHKRGFTLVEVAVATVIIAMLSVALLSATMMARRISEETIIQNAATSIVYGLVEQMKTLNLSNEPDFNQLPSPADVESAVAHVKVRTDNSLSSMTFLTVSAGAPPATTPAATESAASVGASSNVIGPFDLSQTVGVSVQPLNIDLWLWIEPDYQPSAMEPVTRVTLIYTFTVNTGSGRHTFRDAVRFVRANRNIPRST